MTTTQKPVAILHFRTMQNGAFKFMKGNRRGFWRALVVANPAGSLAINSKNVLDVLYAGPVGIDGVTDKSTYNIESSREVALAAVQRFNAN